MVKKVFMFSEREFAKRAKNFRKGEYKEGLRYLFGDGLRAERVISTEEVMVGGFLKSLASLYLGRERVEGADVLMESVRKQREDAVVRMRKQRERMQ
ncbi:hypothetical protein RHSIM_Rhsim05G0089700 [Rhododendron simsii]|uniref:Uncharacterized protein n=1 Tax=Rhododendron simsii TaxID=118357 RepID=A0A834H861_RHOSS|nr:hypothetical protein RHSIM_Rhsim05G0089700 [Rhododendron simsii]